MLSRCHQKSSLREQSGTASPATRHQTLRIFAFTTQGPLRRNTMPFTVVGPLPPCRSQIFGHAVMVTTPICRRHRNILKLKAPFVTVQRRTNLDTPILACGMFMPMPISPNHRDVSSDCSASTTHPACLATCYPRRLRSSKRQDCATSVTRPPISALVVKRPSRPWWVSTQGFLHCCGQNGCAMGLHSLQ